MRRQSEFLQTLARAGVALLLVLSAVRAEASIVYDWSYQDVDQGGANTVSGTLNLPDLCGTSCTNVAATSVILSDAPFGPIGFDFIDATFQFSNLFSTVDGMLTSASFNAWDFGGNGFQLVFSFGLPGGFQFLGGSNDTRRATDNWTGEGGDGSSFTAAAATAVPVPSTLALIGLGLATIPWTRRRNRDKTGTLRQAMPGEGGSYCR